MIQEISLKYDEQSRYLDKRDSDLIEWEKRLKDQSSKFEKNDLEETQAKKDSAELFQK